MSDTADVAEAREAPVPIVPATARGAATRRRLLEAAEREFGERGFHATSVNSVTLRAGVSQGTFYTYFHSKEEIFATLVREIGQGVRRRVAEMSQGLRHPEAAARCSISAFLEFAQQHPGLFRIVQEAQFVDGAAYRRYYDELVHGYRSGIQAAQSRGDLPPGDAEVRTWALIGIAHFLGLRYCLWRGELPDAAVMDEVTRFISRGLDLAAMAKPVES